MSALTDDQRGAITLAKLWLGYGERGLVNALAVLVKAAEGMLSPDAAHWDPKDQS